MILVRIRSEKHSRNVISKPIITSCKLHYKCNPLRSADQPWCQRNIISKTHSQTSQATWIIFYAQLLGQLSKAWSHLRFEKHHIQNPQLNPLSLSINIESLQLIIKLKDHSLASSKKYDASSKKYDASSKKYDASSKKYDASSTKHDDVLECINENKCAAHLRVFLYHTLRCVIWDLSSILSLWSKVSKSP